MEIRIIGPVGEMAEMASQVKECLDREEIRTLLYKSFPELQQYREKSRLG